MNKPAMQVKTLRDVLQDGVGRFMWGEKASVCLRDLQSGSGFAGRLSELAGRSVLLATQEQLPAAVAMIELDGIARRMIICPPDLASEHLPELIDRASVDAVVSDHARFDTRSPDVLLHVPVRTVVTPAARVEGDRHATEWILLTSGTTGVPKMVVHTLASLTAPIKSDQHQGTDVVWGTFYDIRRYGGLQIFLRAVLGRGLLILSSADETSTNHLNRLGAHAVTHLTGTPSHWRRALMSPSAHAIRPRYARLSGEIADQAILNMLHAFYPQAAVGHAFASTEAGVGFEVNDGLEGFPAHIVGAPGDVDIEVEDGSLRLRSRRTASRYVGEASVPLMDERGFVDTGDMVERQGERYYFRGRRSGVINVGGLKVYPEEVEAVLNRHPAVRMSCVRPRRSPITGSLVIADVVLKSEPDAIGGRLAEGGETLLKEDILKLCRETLPRHKVPVALNFVPALAVSATGKMARPHA